MTDTDIKALIKRLRVLNRYYDSDNTPLEDTLTQACGQAADALEALQVRAEKAEAALAELDAAS